jgi:hypothetical protein
MQQQLGNELEVLVGGDDRHSFFYRVRRDPVIGIRQGAPCCSQSRTKSGVDRGSGEARNQKVERFEKLLRLKQRG